MKKQQFGAGIWHFATYVDRYATDGYGEPRSVLDAIELAGKVKDLSVVDINYPYFGGNFTNEEIKTESHAPPEIFVSDGPPGSIVGDWVADRNGVGGVHHIAYQVSDVAGTMKKWKDAGYAEFLSDKPLTCPGLEQVFTKPSELTGVIYELISREGKGFCEDNVKHLMLSTQEL